MSAQNKRKIINDPVFGFINVPNDFLYDIIQHPLFQRLQRIKQLGMASFVYPGAQHTRLQHSLGAMYLTNEAIKQLRQNGHEITADEADGVLAAILLHDVGHGPFSHVLEHTLVTNISHEAISLRLMQQMNSEMGGKLTLAIQIFQNQYPKRFLHQLISSQLDMDRMDYLRRDSFFTGVTEGVVGSARLIKMLDVYNDQLVIKAKGIHSIENFLIARRFMYWQVYFHKTAVAAERMLIKILGRAKELSLAGESLFATPALSYFLNHAVTVETFDKKPETLMNFVLLDDSDILSAIKVWGNHSDVVLSTLSRQFINRKLFKTTRCEPLSALERGELLKSYMKHFNITEHEASYFFEEHIITTSTYDFSDAQIMILFNDGSVKDVTQVSDILDAALLSRQVEKHVLCKFPLFS
ncbi:MAG TPA: HD domain-containing protein [Paludibacteraceae bacterium]|nr:HD domain-containing protein [Paludibacteraceae bacterium]HQB69668.1 HD domain-containing protein [Paludibacteraceae bacterium]